GYASIKGDPHTAHEALADDRSHRAAQKIEFEAGEDQRHALDATLHHDQRVGLAGLLECSGEPLWILLLVRELEAVDRNDLGADLEPALGIEQLLDALACRHARMKRAFRTHEKVVLE